MHLIILLFTKILLIIIKNISSSFSILLLSDQKLQAYLFSAINSIKTIYYLIFQEIFLKLIAVIDICLNINKYKKS